MATLSVSPVNKIDLGDVYFTGITDVEIKITNITGQLEHVWIYVLDSKEEVIGGQFTTARPNKLGVSSINTKLYDVNKTEIMADMGKIKTYIEADQIKKYTKPTLDNIQCYRCDELGNEDSKGEYFYFTAKKTQTYYHKSLLSSVYNNCITKLLVTIPSVSDETKCYEVDNSHSASNTISWNSYTEGFNIPLNRHFIVKAVVEDSLGGKNEYEIIVDGKPVAFNANEHKKSVAIGQYAIPENNRFDMGYNAHFNEKSNFYDEVVMHKPLDLGKGLVVKELYKSSDNIAPWDVDGSLTSNGYSSFMAYVDCVVDSSAQEKVINKMKQILDYNMILVECRYSYNPDGNGSRVDYVTVPMYRVHSGTDGQSHRVNEMLEGLITNDKLYIKDTTERLVEFKGGQVSNFSAKEQTSVAINLIAVVNDDYPENFLECLRNTLYADTSVTRHLLNSSTYLGNTIYHKEIGRAVITAIYGVF